MPIRSIDPDAAHAEMRGTTHAFIDVRTPEEYAAGHPRDAVNIPWALAHPATGMAPNPDFVATVARHYGKATPLYLSCQMGGRSMKACADLQAAGYTDLVNVDGGYGGRPDRPGWAQRGLPVARDDGTTYESLKAPPTSSP